jgi:hypothetical protein
MRLNPSAGSVRVMLVLQTNKGDVMGKSLVRRVAISGSGLVLAAAVTVANAAEDFTAFVVQAKANLVESFKDPNAAQYRGLFVSKDGSLPVLCGEVNGKNSYGAYVGFRKFFATDARALKLIDDPKAPSVFAQMEPSMCGNKIADVQ